MIRWFKKNSSFSIWQPVLIFGALLLVTGIVVACSSGSGVTTASGMATVKVTLSDPATCAAPDGPFSHAYVTISDVQANISSTASSNDSGWVDLTPNLPANPKQVDLLSLSGNQCLLYSLGDNLELQAGSYGQIRLILATSSGSVPGDQCNGMGNCVMLTSDPNDTPHALQLSSEAKTGIKIPSGQIAGGAFTISAGETKDLNIDFNTCASIVQQGNGQYRLKPVLHAAEVGTTAVSMNGTVVDANGNPVEGATVSLEQPDANGVDRIVAPSITTASDGTWAICPLTSGDPTMPYDVVVTGADANGVLYAPSIVTGVSIGKTAGTITLYPPAAALTSASSATLAGQVTSVSGADPSSAGIDIYATLSILEPVNGVDYTIPLPAMSSATPPQTAGSSVTYTTAAQTDQNPPCDPATSYCANYTIYVPSTGAYIGAWSASGATLAQPAGGELGTYVVDGMAIGTSSNLPTCSPSEQQTSALALTGTGPFSVTTGTNLAFTSCTN